MPQNDYPHVIASMRCRFIVGLIVTATACGPRPSAAPDPRPALVQSVYTALLGMVHSGALPDTLLVAESTFVFTFPEIAASDRRVPFDTVPLGLRTRLADVSRVRVSSWTLPFPTAIRVLSEAERREIFRGGPVGWAEFHRRYGKFGRWYAFTPVAFTSDSSQAYVYYEYYCGGLCAGGEGIWLVRSREDGTWRVRLRSTYWIS